MSTYAGRLESASTFDAGTILERRLARYVVGIGGLVAGVGAAVLVGTSGHLVDPIEYGLLLADVIVGTSAVTVYWLVHDASLSADPELAAAAGQTLLLALDSGRLEAELRATVEELRTSRARIASAGDAERRKLERDLHDGAQQHLFAVGTKLELAARDVAERDPELAKELSAVGDELTQVLADLRQLARGVYPSALRDLGLERALASVAWRSAQATSLAATGIGRYPPEVEAAVYFCCVESLQNVARHAGAQAKAEVRLWTAGGELCFTVEDDGEGYQAAPAGAGGGLANMRDRLATFGGTLTVEPRHPRGTRVRGSLPLNGSV